MRRSVSERWLSRDQQEVARRQGWPYPGKLSARPAGKPGDFFVKGEFATIPSRHLLPAHLIPRCLSMRFLRHDGIYRSDVVATKTKPWAKTEPPPVGRPRAQVKERFGRTAPFSSSAMSSDRLFLDRVARQRCPSPLHRQFHPKTVPEWGTMNLQRTAHSVLTVCLSQGDNRRTLRGCAVVCPCHVTPEKALRPCRSPGS